MGPYFNKAHNLGLTLHGIDETLPTINNQRTQKRGKTNKKEGPISKMTNEPPKWANHKGNIKFLSPLGSCKIPCKGRTSRSQLVAIKVHFH
jgi:hypothetical protein